MTVTQGWMVQFYIPTRTVIPIPFVSDVMNSSPTPDNSGKRDVFSSFFELGIPFDF